jgi:uridine monophosphate synthetase
MMHFFERLKKRVDDIGSRLCVGIDPHYYLTSPDSLVAWSLDLAEKTVDNAACFKVNTAFFEAYGHNGVRAMEDVVNKLNDTAPVILDAKRGDIPSTAEAYARSIYRLNCDCITLNPFMGMDSIEPYLDYADQGVFLLCRTSNKGAERFQRGVSLRIAEEAARHSEADRIGLVVGATQHHVMTSIRASAPFNWLLCPGIGKQNGSLEKSLHNGWGLNGNILISSSRSIAESSDPALYTLRLKNELQLSSLFVPPPLRELARLLIETNCIIFGDYRLKSGAVSPFYVDLRRLTGHPRAFKLATEAMVAWTKNLKPQAVMCETQRTMELAQQ